MRKKGSNYQYKIEAKTEETAEKSCWKKYCENQWENWVTDMKYIFGLSPMT